MIHLVKLPSVYLGHNLLRFAVGVIGQDVFGFEDTPIKRIFEQEQTYKMHHWDFVMVKDNTLYRLDEDELESHLKGENFIFYGVITESTEGAYSFTKAVDMQEYCEKTFTRYL